ncbi:hypothetical protein VM1G_08321 [Cytospora mali]|uniref:Uncharacterized protein n=1 Tax=Cytospora mali TaxID=578113 RepID=A0A194W8U6_CYTMA|nr:hypothetical protein VM1G_08321 [Valsa mali]
MREEILPHELRRRREDLDGFGDLTPHEAEAPAPDAQMIRARLESLMNSNFLTPHPHAQSPFMRDMNSTEHLQRALVEFRRRAYRHDKARHHEILMFVVLVLMVLAILLKFILPSVSGRSG